MTWIPTAFPPACGSSSSPSKKTTSLSNAVVDLGCSIFDVGVSFENFVSAQPVDKKPVVSSVLLRGGLTDWKAHSGGDCVFNPAGVLWANLGLSGDPELSHTTTAEAARYHVRSLCLGGGFLVAW